MVKNGVCALDELDVAPTYISSRKKIFDVLTHLCVLVVRLGTSKLAARFFNTKRNKPTAIKAERTTHVITAKGTLGYSLY